MNIRTNLLVQRNPQPLIYQEVNFAHKRNFEQQMLKMFELIYKKFPEMFYVLSYFLKQNTLEIL